MPIITLENGQKVDVDQGIYDDLLKLAHKGMWKPISGEEYYSIMSDGIVRRFDCGSSGTDNNLYNVGNVYSTKEEALKEVDKLKALVRIKDYLHKHNLWLSPDWSDESEFKYYPTYNHQSDAFEIDWLCLTYIETLLPFYLIKKSDRFLIECEDDLRILFGLEEK